MKLTNVTIALAISLTLASPVTANQYYHHRHIIQNVVKPLNFLEHLFQNHKRTPVVYNHNYHRRTTTRIIPVATTHNHYGQQCGGASWYSMPRSRMANGKIMNIGAMTVAHRSLPLGTRIRITNQTDGSVADATVTDRGPFIAGRIVDLTPAVAHRLGISGVEKVCIKEI